MKFKLAVSSLLVCVLCAHAVFASSGNSLLIGSALSGASADALLDLSSATFILRISSSQRNDAKNRLEQVSRQAMEVESSILEHLARSLEGIQVDTRTNFRDLLVSQVDLLARVKLFVDQQTPTWARPSIEKNQLTMEWRISLFPGILGLIESYGYRAWRKKLPEFTAWRPSEVMSSIVVMVDDDLPWYGMNERVAYQPVLLPALLNNKGEVLASYENMDPEYYRAWGFVSFTDAQVFKERPARLGDRPYVIKARGVYGKVPGSVIISDEDFLTIFRSEDGRKAIREGRIIFVNKPDGLSKKL
jgi:hypothetical protein